MTKIKEGKGFLVGRCSCVSQLQFFICFPYRRESFLVYRSRGGWAVGSWESRYDTRDSREGERSLRGAGGARRRGAASLRLIPLVGAGPGHAKRVVFAELWREGSARPAVALMRAWERRADGTARARRSPVKRRPAPDASGGGEAFGRCGTWRGSRAASSWETASNVCDDVRQNSEQKSELHRGDGIPNSLLSHIRTKRYPGEASQSKNRGYWREQESKYTPKRSLSGGTLQTETTNIVEKPRK
jgi:hypothetical protein